MMKSLVFFCLLCSIFSCSQKDPKLSVLPAAKMETVLWELMEAEAFTTEFLLRDSVKNLSAANVALQQKIFAKNNITKVQFYNSYSFYLEHNEAFKILLDSITIKQTKIKENEGLIKVQSEK